MLIMKHYQNKELHMKKKNSLMVSMTKSAFVKEHKSLVSILRHGTKKQLLREAKDQAKELKEKI